MKTSQLFSSRPLSAATTALLLGLAVLACGRQTAHAQIGMLLPGGSQAIGRGGATVARPTDNMAMLQNPAALADLPDSQILFQFDTSFDKSCFDPYGYYGWGVYLTEDRQGNTNNPDDHRSEFGDPSSSRYGDRHLDRVCNSGAIAPTPNIAYSLHVTPKLSLAFGFVAPALPPGAQWGGKDGTIQTDDGARPTPTRYTFIHQEAIAANPTASVAYKALPWLSFGATLQVQMVSADQYFVMAMRAGTSPANDALAKVHAVDLFMPALTFGVQAKASRYLRFAGTFNWSEGVNGHGDLQLTTNNFHQNPRGSELQPLKNDPVKLDRVRISTPWTATLAARFAQPRGEERNDKPGHDALKDEVWDIEIDASYTANKTAGVVSEVGVANDFTLEFRRADGTPQMPLEVSQSDIEEVNVENHLLDTLQLRLGGSVNVVPGRLQLSAGGFFQTRGVEPSYASVSAFSFQRVGLGLGVLVRVGSFDLTAAYSHIFQETITVTPPAHQPRTDATDAPESGFDQRIYGDDGRLSSQPRTDPAAPASGNGVAKLTQSAVFESDDLRRRVINAGRYTARFDVLSIGAVYHF